MKSNIFVELSAPEQSSLGKLLNDMYYKTNLLDLLDREKVNIFGFPHNGGRHTLSMKGDPEELIGFIRVLMDEANTKGMLEAKTELYKIRKALLTQDKVVYMQMDNKFYGENYMVFEEVSGCF